jgi:hypothetical protein
MIEALKERYMKKIKSIKCHLLLAIVLVLAFASCKKSDTNSDGQLEGGKGAPTISSVRTISQSKVDSSRVDIYTTYNADGTTSKTSVSNYQPLVTAFDSTTVTGKLSNYYAIMGSNLGSTTKVLINNVSVPFNRALNSDNTVIFNIPSNTPYVQPLPNTVSIVTLNGSVEYSFTILPPAPTITAASNFNFTANRQLTLKGAGFSAVSAIKLRATNDEVTIVSKTDTQMVIKMPASTANRSSLLYTYTSGTNAAAQTASAQEFVNIDQAYQIFAKNDFQNSWSDNSWAHPSGVSPGNSVSGTASLVATYPAGGWQVEGWANYYPSIDYNPAYKYLVFWVKGGTADHELVLVGDQMAGGYGQVQNANAYAAQKIKVPAKVWTYFKIPLVAPSSSDVNSLNFWKNGTPAKQLGFFLQGQSGDVNETYYFDEVMFVK